MASAAGDSASYGGGAGGKFRRRPLRRPQTTPYDRPPTAVRNTRRNDDNTSSFSSRGWLSRIVDPASKLITASAHSLFSSFFRKRLLPPPPQPSQDAEGEPLENHLGDAMTEDPSRIQERDMIEGNTPSGSMTEGVAELMDALKQKTFTRTEVDRLMVLLQSRKEDNTATEGHRRFELTSSELTASHSRQKDHRGTAFENDHSGVSRNDLTPAVRSNVNSDDSAAPNEFTKAYMGSMCTRVSPSTLRSHSQAAREETPAFATRDLHRPSVSTVQKLSSPAGRSQNDFVVPRSRGRSAIYSMARTPYSRVQPTPTKLLGTSNDAFGGQSLQSLQKPLKRRSSVLENDIGTAGPIRRIRQKPNLLYNATPSGIGEASSSKSHEDKGEKGPISSPHVPSKSIEMGQRILQQLEKLTPPREKSNEKKPAFPGGISGMELTPSMLSGQARKSLETVDSLKCVQDDKLSGKMVDSWNSVREAQDSTPKGQDKFYDSSSNLLEDSSNKIYPEHDEAKSTDNDVMAITKSTTPVVLKSAVVAPKRSPGFQMSAYEDFLDLDDDAHLNGDASLSVNEGKSNLSVSSMMSNGKLPEHPYLVEATKPDRPTFPTVESFSNSALKNATTVDGSNAAENGISHNFTNSILNKTNGSSIASLEPDKPSASAKADVPASTIGFGLESSHKLSSPDIITSPVVEPSISKNVTSSVFSIGVASTNAAVTLPGCNNESTESVDLVKKSDNGPSAEPGSSFSTISSFGSFPLKSAPASSPLLFSSQSLSSGIPAQSTFTTSNTGVSATASSSSVATSVTFPTFQSTFKGSSLASDSSNLSDLGGKSKETAFGNLTSSNLAGTASAPAQASAISGFQFGVTTSSGTSSSQLEASATKTFSSHSILGDQTLPSTTIISASTTECIPSQPTASTSPVSSVSSSLPMNSGSLASASAPVTSSSPFGLSSSTIFGGSPQPSNSQLYGSAFNNSSSSSSSSALNSFGVSAAPTPSSSPSPSGFAFGMSSMSAPANGSSAVAPFGSSSNSTAFPSPTFGSSASAPSGSVLSSGFAFGASSISSPANSSFGAVSSSSATSSSTPSAFGFGVSSSASSSAPSSSFSFGLSPTSANSGATSSTFSFGASSASPSSGVPASSFAFGASTVSASSSAPSSSFAFGASTVSASSSAPSSSFAFGAPPVSANSSVPSSTFSFGASSSSAPSSTFSFGASSSSAPSTTPSSPFLFGASSASATPATTTTPVFPFGSAASTPPQQSQPAFGNSSSIFGFGSTPSSSPLGSNDQMSMEDSMVEDSSSMHQSPSLTPTPVFGQTLPTNNFSFGMAQAQAPSPSPAPASLGANPFQFGGQPNQAVAPPNPFQASGSFDGGSFSLGAGGNGKSNRRIVKPKGRRKK